ncbi:MAG: hypothetical protein ACI8S6_005204 [Myxococcota bacterium]
MIEDFRDGEAEPVYRRFQAEGRLMGPRLSVITSVVTEDLRRCYQIMACDDRAQLDAWIARWSDLVVFQVVPVLSSAEAMVRALS